MILLADRNFAAGFLAAQAAAARAEFLIRARTGRGGPGLPVPRRLPDGSWLSRFGGVPVRVTDADRASFAVALNTAREQVILAAGRWTPCPYFSPWRGAGR